MMGNYVYIGPFEMKYRVDLSYPDTIDAKDQVIGYVWATSLYEAYKMIKRFLIEDTYLRIFNTGVTR